MQNQAAAMAPVSKNEVPCVGGVVPNLNSHNQQNIKVDFIMNLTDCVKQLQCNLNSLNLKVNNLETANKNLEAENKTVY